MNPAKTPTTRPAPLAVTVPAEPAGPGQSVSLSVLGLLLGLGALLVAAGAGYGLALLFGSGQEALAALAAALGVLAAGVPLAWLMVKLAREAGPAGHGVAPSAGMDRPLFMILAEREFARARRYGTGAALLLVEVDRYARLCEARGAAAGEAVLQALLRQTAPTLRTADVLTLYADNQMAVFLAHADATGALDVAERIRERAEQLEVALSPHPQPLRVTVAVGVTHLRPAHLNLLALVDDTEDAVLAARQAGGNCVRAAPLDAARGRTNGPWRDARRAQPKQGGPT